MLLLGYGSQAKVHFDSLQAHTCGQVRWRALDEWKEVWDTCRKDLIKLREEAYEVLSGHPQSKAKINRQNSERKRGNENTAIQLWLQLKRGSERRKVATPARGTS